MSFTTSIATPSQQRLVDEMVDAYAHWRGERGALRSAYDRWSSASRGEASLAAAACEAALDREERASHVYEDLVGRVRQLVGSDDVPAEWEVAAKPSRWSPPIVVTRIWRRKHKGVR